MTIGVTLMAGYKKSEAQDWAWENLKGQWSTLMTPFTQDDELDEAGLRENIRHIKKLGTRGGGCSWGMGEFWNLTREERLRIYDVVSDEAKGNWLIAANVTHNSVKEMTLLADYAEMVGFDLLITSPPSIGAKTESQVTDYVELLASKTSLAIMFYNTPQFGLVMSPQGLQKICRIPNVVGVKEASFNQTLSLETHQLVGKEAIISTPDEWIFFKEEELGFHQQVMFANTSDWRFDTPEENYYVQFIEKATNGDIDRNFYNIHLKNIKALNDKWWGYQVQKFGGLLPAAMCKYWGTLMGLKHGHVRPPLKEMTLEEKAELKGDLQNIRLKTTATRR